MLLETPARATTPAEAELVVVRPSEHAGMGAIPYAGGTAFRVWAPFADAVYIVGSFNIWNPDANPLASEGNGYWSCDIPDARPGHQYKYVVRRGPHTYWRNDPYARDVTSSRGNTIITDPRFDWPEADYRPAPWHELVIYQLHTGTFYDRPRRRPGSFRSVLRKLHYLSDLGVNAIELLPALTFDGDFSWGYSPAQIFAIERACGGPRALKRLVRAAHQRSIAVIFDGIYSHFGPNDLDLWQFDGWSENGKGGIYFYNDARSHTPWGNTRPDYGRPEVRNYIRDNVHYWLGECHLDGLRWDATSFIRNMHGNNNDPVHDIADGWRLLQAINNETDARYPAKLQIAEDLRDNPWITRDTAAGGAGFDTQWDGAFAHRIRAALTTSNDMDRDMHAVRAAILHRYGGNAFARVIYTESHDELANGRARLPEKISPARADSWAARKRSTLGAALVLTAPGIPLLFQGQEFLEHTWYRNDSRAWLRAQMNAGIVDLYRELIRLRRNWYDHTRGLRGQHVNVFHVNHHDKVIAFHRWENGGPRDDVVVVANFANRGYDSYVIGFPRHGRWRVRFNSDSVAYSRAFGNVAGTDTDACGVPADGLPTSGSVGIGPYSAVILSQDDG